MTRETISQALNQLSDRHVEAVASFQGKKKHSGWQKIGAVAACLCLIITIGGVIVSNRNSQPYLSAEDVDQMFQLLKSAEGATTAYTKVYWPESKQFVCKPLPTEKVAEIYKINAVSNEFSKNELSAMADEVMPKLTTSIGLPMDSFQKRDHDIVDNRFTVSYKSGTTELDFTQSSGESSYGVDFSTNSVWIHNSQEPLSLNGKTIQINGQQSEEEILTSLEWVRDELFAIFGCAFDGAEIRFDYGDTYESAIDRIDVYYYNTVQKVDWWFFYRDYISISFDKYHVNATEESLHSDTIDTYSISYHAYRNSVEDCRTVEAKCKLISLEEAEQQLAKGYVFGGHSCPLCMDAQDAISFDAYDFVEYEYVTDLYGELARSIPFYAFYKKSEPKKMAISFTRKPMCVLSRYLVLRNILIRKPSIITTIRKEK